MVFTEAELEHRELRDSARRLFTDLGSFYHSSAGVAPDFEHAWKAMADLGLFAFPVPEECGGLGGDAAGALAILEESGRALSASSLLSNVMVAPGALAVLHDSALCDAFMAGAAHFSYAPSGANNLSLRAERRGDAVVLHGETAVMLGGARATNWLIAVPLGGDDAVLLNLSRQTHGIPAETVRLLDNSDAVRLCFSGTVIPADAILASGAAALALIGELDDRAAAGAVAEAFGALEAGFHLTAAYLQQRVQFGQPIAGFQAVQHRMAEAFCSLEQLRSLLVWCAVALEQSAAHREQAVSAAKSYLCRRGIPVIETCIQVSGGVGVSEEYVLGHYYKRILVRAALFGDARYHTQRLYKQVSIDDAFKGPMT